MKSIITNITPGSIAEEVGIEKMIRLFLLTVKKLKIL